MEEIVNQRIITKQPAAAVLDAIAEHLTRMHATLERGELSIKATNPRKSKDESVGAETVVTVTLANKDDGWLVNAEIKNEVKANFLIWLPVVVFVAGLIFSSLIMTIGSAVGFCVAAVRGANHGKVVKPLIAECLALVNNQFAEAVAGGGGNDD